MIKGIYKEFVTVKLSSNPVYEEAIFIIKRTANEKKSKNDLLFEANRILCEQEIKKPRKRCKILKKVFFSSILLILGGVSGALITFFLLN